MDWGMALSVGLAIVIISEVTILAALILPKIPLEPGKTWRGTVSAVSTISIIIGGVGGYIAGQFGGRGGGGARVPGQALVSTEPVQQTPRATQTTKVEATRPERPDSYLAATVDIYFLRDKDSKLIHFNCELAGYRRKGNTWELFVSKVVAKDLAEFLKLTSNALGEYQKDIPPVDLPAKRLRIFRDPDPGDGVYDQLRQQAEKQGWKVDRKDVAWQPEYPTNN